MRVLIIEDEAITANALAECITEVRPGYTLLPILSSVRASIEYLSSSVAYDLIFSDIQLGDGLSFEIFRQLQLSKPIIFCTAYDEYALEAFKTNGVAYLLKPFDCTQVRAAIDKVETIISPAVEQLQRLLLHLLKPAVANSPQSLLVYHQDKIIPIDMQDIAALYLDNGAGKLVTFDGRTFSSTQSLDEFEAAHHPQFFRVNRQYLLHRKAIKEVAQYFQRKLLINPAIKLAGPIIVSKEKTGSFLAWLASSS